MENKNICGKPVGNSSRHGGDSPYSLALRPFSTSGESFHTFSRKWINSGRPMAVGLTRLISGRQRSITYRGAGPPTKAVYLPAPISFLAFARSLQPSSHENLYPDFSFAVDHRFSRVVFAHASASEIARSVGRGRGCGDHWILEQALPNAAARDLRSSRSSRVSGAGTRYRLT